MLPTSMQEVKLFGMIKPFKLYLVVLYFGIVHMDSLNPKWQRRDPVLCEPLKFASGCIFGGRVLPYLKENKLFDKNAKGVLNPYFAFLFLGGILLMLPYF